MDGQRENSIPAHKHSLRGGIKMRNKDHTKISELTVSILFNFGCLNYMKHYSNHMTKVT